jgi:hypothetical protein
MANPMYKEIKSPVENTSYISKTVFGNMSHFECKTSKEKSVAAILNTKIGLATPGI